MTQNARVARWVPTADPAETGDNVVTIAAPTAGKSLATKFQLGAGGSGGIPEAPKDGTPYARQDANWVQIVAPTVIDAGTF